jgi:hypothetical protein
MTDSLSDAILLQRSQLGTKGILELSAKVRFPPTGLATLTFPNLKILILKNSPLKSLATLPPLPKLKTIIADKSQIEVLTGLGTHPRLTSLSLAKTPVSQTPNFRLAVLILIPKLSNINGIAVTQSERHASEAYPPIAKQLVNKGWIVPGPPPSEADFRYLVGYFEITEFCEADFVLPLVAKGKSPPTSPVQREGDEGWPQKVAAILVSLGFPIRSGEKMHADIVSAVRQLCDVVVKVEKLEQEIAEEGEAEDERQ